MMSRIGHYRSTSFSLYLRQTWKSLNLGRIKKVILSHSPTHFVNGPFFIFIVFCICISFNACTFFQYYPPEQAAADLPAVKTKLKTLAKLKAHQDEQHLNEILQNISDRGTWPDIDYAADTRGRWPAAEHWKRLLAMAVAYRDEAGPYYTSTEVREKLIKGLGFWLDEQPRAANWWWNVIDIPLKMGQTGLLMEDVLSDHHMQEMLHLMSRRISVKRYYTAAPDAGGQNLLWLAQVDVMKACLKYEAKGLGHAFSAAKEAIGPTEKEGIQHDYSFHQHGPQLYMGTYGKEFAISAAELAFLAEGTLFEFTDQELAELTNYILDGLRWVIYKGQLDYSVMGRKIAAKSNGRLDDLGQACRLLSQTSSFRKSELIDLYNDLENPGGNNSLVGTKCFWESDFLVHRRENYYVSLKMASDRVVGTEYGNGENLSGYHLGHGITFIMQDGKEYADIFPVWNWRQLPGLLCEQNNDPYLLYEWGEGASGNTRFVGGVSDGLSGCAAFNYQFENISAKRAWFFLDHGLVGLVAGLESSSDDPVTQSINQCVSGGHVVFSEKSRKKILEQGRYVSSDIQWVYHDNIRYMSLYGADPIYIRRRKKTGEWQQINENYSDEMVSKNVFSIGISLGARLRNKRTAYMVLPDVLPGQVESRSLNPGMDIIANSAEQQAIWYDKRNMLMAVFYESGSLSWGARQISLAVDRPCLIMIQVKKDGVFEVTAADPTQRHKKIGVLINKQYPNQVVEKNIHINLLQGPYAGQSVKALGDSIIRREED